MPLDAPITTYLPYFEMEDPRAKTITVRQLLTHTSGMPDVEDYEWDRPQYDDGALERYVRSLEDQKLVFAPGERIQYSNIAYEILGDAVAKVSGMTFEEYVRQNVLFSHWHARQHAPREGDEPRADDVGPRARRRRSPVRHDVYPYNRAHTPSSDLHSNVLDMSRGPCRGRSNGGPSSACACGCTGRRARERATLPVELVAPRHERGVRVLHEQRAVGHAERLKDVLPDVLLERHPRAFATASPRIS